MKGFTVFSRALVVGLVVIAALPAAAGATSNVAGDFNGDGADDLAVGVPDEDLALIQAGAVHVIYGTPGTGLDSAAALADQFFHQNRSGIQEVVEASDNFGNALAAGDFDQDGFDDLAVGARTEDLTGISSNDGVVHVLYGSATGLTFGADDLWSQDIGTIQSRQVSTRRSATRSPPPTSPATGSTTSRSALPRRTSPARPTRGSCTCSTASPRSGLTDTGNQLFDQGTGALPGTSEQSDLFADNLGAGDLNGDGIADLVIGAEGEDVGGDNGAGAVSVLYGAVGGLTDVGSQEWDQDSAGIDDAAEPDDLLGEALAVGDMNGDGFGELAAGAIQEEVGGTDAGGVSIIYGSAGVGLTSANNSFLTQDTAGVKDTPEHFDAFGEVLVSYDANGDGTNELAVGVPGEDRVAGAPDHGIFQTFQGIPGAGSRTSTGCGARTPPGSRRRPSCRPAWICAHGGELRRGRVRRHRRKRGPRRADPTRGGLERRRWDQRALRQRQSPGPQCHRRSVLEPGLGRDPRPLRPERPLRHRTHGRPGQLDAQSSRYGTVVTIRCRSNSSTRLT